MNAERSRVQLSSTTPSTLRRMAQLYGLTGGLRDLSGADSDYRGLEGARLIAADWTQLKPEQAQRLGHLVQAGAVLYIRGPFVPGRVYSLAPLSSDCFAVSTGTALEYRFSNHALIPPGLNGESVEAGFAIPAADRMPKGAQPLLSAITQGRERPVIFALAIGAGVAIFDLQPEDPSPAASEVPIVHRLSDPQTRCADVGALIAATRAAAAGPRRQVAYDLILDDRPANYDYFHGAALAAWLAHMRGLCADVHVDFAWTPNQNRPSRRYIEILKRFDSGFLWHGFHRHIDHRRISDLEGTLAHGKRLVEEIERRYGVKFQPVMIFPFEHATPEALRILKHAGFVAGAETGRQIWDAEAHLPPYLRYSTPLVAQYTGFFPVLRRYSLHSLNYDRLLALSALQLPILAAAHPRDVALRHLGRLRDSGNKNCFDKVLMFAAGKGLRPRSLEQIASEVLGTL